MENIIMAVCYKNEKNERKIEKLICKLIIYVQKSTDKSSISIDFLKDMDTITINVKDLNSIDYYLKMLFSGCLNNQNFNSQAISIIGTRKEILEFIKYKIPDLKSKKKIMIIKGNEYFAI